MTPDVEVACRIPCVALGRRYAGPNLRADAVAAHSKGASMRTINILAMQRTSAADRARIEAVDPAIRLTDAGGWFDGEIRETWPAFATARYLGPNANGHGTREERDQLLAEAEVILGGFPFILDMRSQGAEAQMVPSAPGGGQQPDQGRPVGQRRGGDDLARRRQHAADRGIRRGEHAAFRQGPAPRRRRPQRRRSSTIAPIGRSSCRARPPASSAPAASASTSAGCAPRSACASSAPAGNPSRERPCPPASASSAAPAISTGSCP